jgi:hypothetical protein
MHHLSFHFNLFLKFCALCFLLVLTQCVNEQSKKIPDVSSIDIQVKIKRFERDLIALDTLRIAENLPPLQAQYPKMLELFTTQIIHDQGNPDETPEQALQAFLTAPPVRNLFDTVQRAFPDLSSLENDLSQMFRYYKYYLPEKPTPEVVTIVSEYATDAFTYGDSLCGIGLDMFLGEQFAGYDPQIFPAYIRRQFHPSYIPVRLAKAIAQDAVGAPKGQALLDMMLLNGKALYLANCMLPHTPDSLIMGYTRDQMAGCYSNEQGVWARLLEQNLLYSNDVSKFRKLVMPSPNAPIVFAEAPGEIGNWVGWQIVKAYMKRYPDTTMPELIAQKDAQAFLEKARYKPKKG